MMRCYECGTNYSYGSCPHCAQRKVLERTETIEKEKLELARSESRRDEILRQEILLREQRNTNLQFLAQLAIDINNKEIAEIDKITEEDSVICFAEIVELISLEKSDFLEEKVIDALEKFCNKKNINLNSKNKITEKLEFKFAKFIIDHPSSIDRIKIAKKAFNYFVSIEDEVIKEVELKNMAIKEEAIALQKNQEDRIYEEGKALIRRNLLSYKNTTKDEYHCLECGYKGVMGYNGKKGIFLSKLKMKCPSCNTEIIEQ